MSKWKNVRTYLEVNPYTGQPVEEDIQLMRGRGAVVVSVLSQMVKGLTQRKEKENSD